MTPKELDHEMSKEFNPNEAVDLIKNIDLLRQLAELELIQTSLSIHHQSDLLSVHSATITDRTYLGVSPNDDDILVERTEIVLLIDYPYKGNPNPKLWETQNPIGEMVTLLKRNGSLFCMDSDFCEECRSNKGHVNY